MPESSLRWGARLGGLAAGLGVVAYFVGAFLTPVRTKELTGDTAIPILLIRGLFVLIALGAAFGFAYYAGMRVAREQLSSTAQPSTFAANSRVPSVLAGGIVIFAYWVLTRVVGALFVFAPFQPFSSQELGGDVFFGLLFVVLGAGLGGVGARMAFSSKAVESVIVVSPPPPRTPTPVTLTEPADAEQTQASAE